MVDSQKVHPTQLSTDLRMTMDLFQHRHYKLTKNLLCFFGLWPEQSKRVRYIIRIVMLSIILTVSVPVFSPILHNIDDWDILMECAISILFGVLCFVKWFCCILYSKKILMMLNHIRVDWQDSSHDCDADILHKYAEQGRTMTLVYTIMCSPTCAIYLMQPVVPKIIDSLLKNGTAPGQFSLPIDYYCIDMQKYYFYIVLHYTVGVSLAFYSSLSFDCLFMVFVQHGCGLFATLGRKLQRIGSNETSGKAEDITRAANESDVKLKHLGLYIDKHLNAIEYADLMEETYSWCYFVVMGVNILLNSVTGLQIIKRSIDGNQTISFVFGNILSMTHLYIDNYMAQNLMDHSICIRDNILNAEWYNLPPKAQKVLLLIINRCNVPCTLTAGKWITLSIETFGSFMKVSVSYLTLLRSV